MPVQLSDSITLPCGLVLPNRLSKASMAEQLSNSNEATTTLVDAYRQWAQGGWGCILTGNVQVDVDHLGSMLDPALDSEYTGDNKVLLSQWKNYADTCQRHGTPTIVQICHPGRQSLRYTGRRGLFAPTIAPSAVPINVGDGLLQRAVAAAMWTPPREMTQQDIQRVIRQFVDAARLMADAGFSGVELHGAHGYLLTQFLDAKTNLRTDKYGGTAEKRAQFILEILAKVRKVVPASFCVGIKLNSADHNSVTFEDAMTQIKLLVEAGIDFMEISGGTYEDPKFLSDAASAPAASKSARTASREAFFLEFAKEVRQRHPDLILMLTGGFRSRAGAESAIRDNACDLVGFARPAVINARFPELLLDKNVPDEKAVLPLNKVPIPCLGKLLSIGAIGAGAESTYYAGQIGRLSKYLPTKAPAS